MDFHFPRSAITLGFTVGGRVQDVASGHGLGGVKVSNGETIVETDSTGYYSIHVEPGTHRFLTVTIPDGYRAEDGFFHSTVGLRQGNQVVFNLARCDVTRVFKVAQITDTHLSCKRDSPKSWTRDVLPVDLKAICEKDDPDLIVATGDLTKRGRISQLKALREVLSGSRVSVIPVFGGHDGNDERYSGKPGETFTHHYEDILGPLWYSFERGDRHFIVYVKEDHFLSSEDADRKERWFWGDLDLQPPGREIVVFMHTPPPKEFLDKLAHHNVRLVLYGHWHSSKVFKYKGITVAATQPLVYGGIDTEPRGYRLVVFKKDGFDVRMRHLSEGGPTDPSSKVFAIRTSKGDLKLSWRILLESRLHRSSPVNYGNLILVSLRDEHMGSLGGVCCIDLATGRELWRTRTDASVKNSVAVGTDCTNGRVACAAASVTGRVYLLDVNTGRIIWHRDLPGFPDRWIYTSPMISKGIVFCGAKSGYAAYRVGDGSELWYAEVEGNDAWSCYASPQPCRDTIVVLISRRGLIALNREDGGICWETELPVEYYYASPAITDGKIITGGDREKLALLYGDTGEIGWHGGDLVGRYSTALAVDGDKIFATTSDGAVQCNDLLSGERYWTFEVGQDLLDMTPYMRANKSVLARPFIWGDDLIVCGCDGFLYVLDKFSGDERNRLNFGSPITASPCSTDDGICVGTFEGNLYRFSKWNPSSTVKS